MAVVPIHGAKPDDDKPTLLDVAAGLRNLADAIDRGERGAVVRLAWVVRSESREPEVGGLGAIEHIAQIYMDLHAGADQLMSIRSPERAT